MAEIARLHPVEDKSFRLAPHNVEAEQALLGAILINNDAFYRVSDFLNPEHFYEPIHRDIYELAGKIIRAGKSADPTTIKTHLPEQLLPDITMAQYLARLAAEATTVLNAAQICGPDGPFCHFRNHAGRNRHWVDASDHSAKP